jgi:ribosomal protein S12 methylthiotransferase accessory factor
MESVEGYNAEHITLPLKFANFNEMRLRHRVVDVETLPRAPDSHFHGNLPLLWVEGQDLLLDEPVWVPFQMVHTVYTRDLDFDLKCFAASSTGLAAGNHILEAASHAICEAVERDASGRWSQLPESEREAGRLDLNTVDDPSCREALARLERAGVGVAVWDITSPVGIPTFECLISDIEVNSIRPVCSAGGSGCHPLRQIALLRAITEAVQSRLTVIAGARDDMGRHHYEHWLDPDVLQVQSDRVRIMGSRPFLAAPTFESESFEDDVAWELKRVQEAGFGQVVLIDLTLPEFALPVVRVLIPGMETSKATNVETYGSRGRSAPEGLA